MSPAEQMSAYLRECAQRLNDVADIADMQAANSLRSRCEEAAAYIAFLFEICRPVDDLIRKVMIIADDNTGALSLSDRGELRRSQILTEAVAGEWIPLFRDFAGDTGRKPDSYQREYVRRLRDVERARLFPSDTDTAARHAVERTQEVA